MREGGREGGGREGELIPHSYSFSLDINECLLDPPVCSDVCTNTQGSYSCSCSEGFMFGEDGTTCVDIDECLESEKCEQICTNTDGSFMCECEIGYSLDTDDGASCVGESSIVSLRNMVIFL